jgi:hypothetical protein
MSQDSSLTQSGRSVRQALTAYSVAKSPSSSFVKSSGFVAMAFIQLEAQQLTFG